MWALAIVDPSVYATPYIIALMVCIVVFSVLLLKFRSLWSVHRKSIFTVYGIITLVVGLLIFQAHDAGLGPTHIGYDYALSANTFEPNVVNQFNVTSGTNGIRPIYYNLVLTSKNASFTEDNPQEYIRVDNTTIKIPCPFNEAKPATLNKSVFFKIDQNTTGFSIDTNLEASPNSNIIVTTWTGTMQCDYNAKLNSYTVEYIARTSA
jgi:hypothetical protein